MHVDAERIAKRFIETVSTFDGKVSVDYEALTKTFDEMLRAELIFGGPSLYADPAV